MFFRKFIAVALMKIKPTAIFLILVYLCLISCKRINNNAYTLKLYNDKTNDLIKQFENVNEFSVKFIHSVHKNPLWDFYKIENGKIIVYKTTYYDFGAGVQSELNNSNEKFYINENNELVVDNINKTIDNLVYVVGTYSDHILNIKGEEISLIKLCGKNTHVRFEVK